MLYFVNNKIMISNLTSTFLLFTLGGGFFVFVDIIKTDRFRIWPSPGGVGRQAGLRPQSLRAPQPRAPLPLVAAPWRQAGDIPGQGGQARRPPGPTCDGHLLQGGEPSLTTAPPQVRRRECSVKSTMVVSQELGKFSAGLAVWSCA